MREVVALRYRFTLSFRVTDFPLSVACTMTAPTGSCDPASRSWPPTILRWKSFLRAIQIARCVVEREPAALAQLIVVRLHAEHDPAFAGRDSRLVSAALTAALTYSWMTSSWK